MKNSNDQSEQNSDSKKEKEKHQIQQLTVSNKKNENQNNNQQLLPQISNFNNDQHIVDKKTDQQLNQKLNINSLPLSEESEVQNNINNSKQQNRINSFQILLSQKTEPNITQESQTDIPKQYPKYREFFKFNIYNKKILEEKKDSQKSLKQKNIDIAQLKQQGEFQRRYSLIQNYKFGQNNQNTNTNQINNTIGKNTNTQDSQQSEIQQTHQAFNLKKYKSSQEKSKTVNIQLTKPEKRKFKLRRSITQVFQADNPLKDEIIEYQRKVMVLKKFQKAVMKCIHLLRFYQHLHCKQDTTTFSHKQKLNITTQITKRSFFLPIYPRDLFKQMWNISLIMMLILTAIITPIRVGFIDDRDVDDWYYIDLSFDIYFGVDIIVNFLSAYHDEKNKLITKFSGIIKNYLTGWFPIDFIATFPFDILLDNIDGTSSYNKLFRLMRLPRLYRLARIVKLSKGGSDSVIQQLFEVFQMNLGVRQMFNIMMMMLLMSHFASSFWYFIARIEDFNEETWVSRLGLVNSTYIEKYISSFYWAFQTLTTVGYGDVPAVTVSEQIFALFWMILGVGFYSFTIGNLAVLLQDMNQSGALYDIIHSQFEDLALKCDVPENICGKVYKFYEQNYKLNRFWGGDYITYSKQLYYQHNEEIAFLSYQHLLQKNSISVLKQDFSFAANILPSLSFIRYVKNDVIYREFDPAEEVFFLMSGSVSITNENGVILLTIQSSYHFGEDEAISYDRRKYFAIANTDCLVTFCKADIFRELLERYENIDAYFMRKQAIRNKKIQKKLDILEQMGQEKTNIPVKTVKYEVKDQTYQTQYRSNKEIQYLVPQVFEHIYNSYGTISKLRIVEERKQDMRIMHQSVHHRFSSKENHLYPQILFKSQDHYRYFMEGQQKHDKSKEKKKQNMQLLKTSMKNLFEQQKKYTLQLSGQKMNQIVPVSMDPSPQKQNEPYIQFPSQKSISMKQEINYKIHKQMEVKNKQSKKNLTYFKQGDSFCDDDNDSVQNSRGQSILGSPIHVQRQQNHSMTFKGFSDYQTNNNNNSIVDNKQTYSQKFLIQIPKRSQFQQNQLGSPVISSTRKKKGKSSHDDLSSLNTRRFENAPLISPTNDFNNSNNQIKDNSLNTFNLNSLSGQNKLMVELDQDNVISNHDQSCQIEEVESPNNNIKYFNSNTNLDLNQDELSKENQLLEYNRKRSAYVKYKRLQQNLKEIDKLQQQYKKMKYRVYKLMNQVNDKCKQSNNCNKKQDSF